MQKLLKLQLENEIETYARILSSPRKGVLYQILLARSATHIQIIKDKINEAARKEDSERRHPYRVVYDVLKAMCGFGDNKNARDNSVLSLSQKTISPS